MFSSLSNIYCLFYLEYVRQIVIVIMTKIGVLLCNFITKTEIKAVFKILK